MHGLGELVVFYPFFSQIGLQELILYLPLSSTPMAFSVSLLSHANKDVAFSVSLLSHANKDDRRFP
jgi:hypothetical protein